MKKNQIYAIVDIESTGGNIENDRMIQFACVLLENGEILESFDTYVNPLKNVPKRIQELTGISSKEVKEAPYFEDIAPVLYSMLEQTIFVAHNVGFDFQFLNQEFQRAGFPKLTIPAIDTVELAQVIFPTSNSYVLQEIVEWLGYDLDRPHNALFDAEATVFLLKKMDEKLQTLPLTTVEKLAELSHYCIAETYLFFIHALDIMKKAPKDLSKDLVIAEGIALKDSSICIQDIKPPINSFYPESSKSKTAFFDDSYLKRSTQEEMMDTVYQYFKKSEKMDGLAIEASSGLGKSLGYMLPISFIATSEKPILISTKTTILQRQMVEETFAYLNQFLAFPLKIASVKGKYHYLSLANFEYKLKHVDLQDIEALFCMRILVWLTETTTGDLDELGAGGNNSHDFWTEVRVGQANLTSKTFQKWKNLDFYHRAQKALDQAAIIVTNHAFLVHDWKKEKSLFSDVERILIDEAHFFPDVVQSAATETISYNSFISVLKKFGTLEKENSIIATLYELSRRNIIKEYQIQSIETNKTLFESEWEAFIDYWVDQLNLSREKNSKIIKWQERSVEFSQLSLPLKRTVKELTRLVYEVVYVGNHIINKSLEDKDQLSSSEQFNMLMFNDFLEELTNNAQSFKTIFDQNSPGDHSWISYYSKKPSSTLKFNRTSLYMKEKLLHSLQDYSHVVYTSSTLSYNRSIDFFKKQLELDNLRFVELLSSYNYEKNTKVYVPEKLLAVKESSNDDYIGYLTDSIEILAKEVDENALILFRSIDSLQRVYHNLQNKKSLDNKLILAQNISGTKSKLLKQFKKNRNALLLGADSFWEGIDLPGDSLKIVIVTRLPFDSPELPAVKMRYKEILAQNQNPFVQDTLPRAVLRMKQGFGRLIRSENDKGILIILDSRYIESSYAHIFKQALPPEVKIEQLPLKVISKEINHFLKDGN